MPSAYVNECAPWYCPGRMRYLWMCAVITDQYSKQVMALAQCYYATKKK